MIEPTNPALGLKCVSSFPDIKSGTYKMGDWTVYTERKEGNTMYAHHPIYGQSLLSSETLSSAKTEIILLEKRFIKNYIRLYNLYKPL